MKSFIFPKIIDPENGPTSIKITSIIPDFVSFTSFLVPDGMLNYYPTIDHDSP